MISPEAGVSIAIELYKSKNSFNGLFLAASRPFCEPLWTVLQESADVWRIISGTIIILAGLDVKSSAGEYIGIIYVARRSWLVVRILNIHISVNVIFIHLNDISC